VKDCVARSHLNGHRLDGGGGKGKGKSNSRRNDRSNGKSNNRPNADASAGGKLSEILQGMKANKTQELSFDEVKQAISKATSFHVSAVTMLQPEQQPATIARRLGPEVFGIVVDWASARDTLNSFRYGRLRSANWVIGYDPVKVNVYDQASFTVSELNKRLQSVSRGCPSVAYATGDAVVRNTTTTVGAEHITNADSLIEFCRESDSGSDHELHAASNRAIVLDSGSGVHISPDVSVTNPSDLCRISGFSGADAQVSAGTGEVVMQLESDQGHHVELPITRVHHVDGIPDDIVSLARLVQESSYSFHATPEGSFLEAPDNSQIPVMIEDGVFVLEDRSKCNFVRSNRKEATLQELHVRLGHASKQCMMDTLHNTFGISCDLKELDDFFCTTCALANSKRQAITSSRDPSARSTKVG